ncbi:MAG: GspH/FimT family protein, partial [Chromatocurvus sp.]
ACGNRYDQGWFVYLDRDSDGVFDAAGDTLLRRFAAMPGGFGLYNRAGSRRINERVSFWPDGSSRRSMTLQVCPPAGGRVQPWSLVLNHVGRPRLSRDWGSCIL